MYENHSWRTGINPELMFMLYLYHSVHYVMFLENDYI